MPRNKFLTFPRGSSLCTHYLIQMSYSHTHTYNNRTLVTSPVTLSLRRYLHMRHPEQSCWQMCNANCLSYALVSTATARRRNLSQWTIAYRQASHLCEQEVHDEDKDERTNTFLHRKTNLPILSSRKISSATCILLPLLPIILPPPPPLVFTSTLISGFIVLSFQSNPFSHSPFSQLTIFHHAFTMCHLHVYSYSSSSSFFFFFFMVRITATHLSALSLPWTDQHDHSTSWPSLSVPHRQWIPVSSNNARSHTLYFLLPPDIIWDNRIQPNWVSPFFLNQLYSVTRL
jgi:hypothetical protein